MLTDWMAEALDLAVRGQGRTAPNPCVGAVLVRDGRVVARGWHKKFGGPHAEVEAIADARKKGLDTKGCTMAVTLEPCNHFGKTPPCTRAILDAGISRVLVGVKDPNPDVAGGGVEFLRSRGVEVECGVLADSCADMIRDFVHWGRSPRAFSILKLAATLDGRIAARAKKPEAVSGPASHVRVHDLRSTAHAIIVGGETFHRDNPRLTVRKDGWTGPQPLAVLVTGRLPDPEDSFCLLRERPEQTVFWTTVEQADSSRARDLEAMGCRIWAGRENKEDSLYELLVRLRTDAGCYRVVCEGGGRLAGSLLDKDFVDEFWLFQAMKILGDDKAVSACSGRTAGSLDQALNFTRFKLEFSGRDILLHLRPQRPD